MSDTNEREDDFNAWYIRQDESIRDFDVMRMAWQARGELEAKKLEGTTGYKYKAELYDEVWNKALSTTTPDTALQKALLWARIDECEASMIQYEGDDPIAEIYKRVVELRAQLAVLGE